MEISGTPLTGANCAAGESIRPLVDASPMIKKVIGMAIRATTKAVTLVQ